MVLGMYSEKLTEAFNDGFNLLVSPQIIEEVRHLERITPPANLLGIEQNFTKNNHRISFLYWPDNPHFNPSYIESEILREKAITQVLIFKDKELDEHYCCVDGATFIVENSYDSSNEVRKEIQKVFKNWCPCNEKFLGSCLDCFDGDIPTTLNAVSLNYKDNTNSVITYISYDTNEEKNKKIIRNLCRLYEITSTVEDYENLEILLEKIRPILSVENKMKLSFETKHTKPKVKEINLIIHPTLNNYRHEIVQLTSNCLAEEKLLDQSIADQLHLWQPETIEKPWGLSVNLEPYKGRLKGYIKIKILKDTSVRTEILSCYGVI